MFIRSFIHSYILNRQRGPYQQRENTRRKAHNQTENRTGLYALTSSSGMLL